MLNYIMFIPAVIFSIITVFLIQKVTSHFHIGSLPSPRKIHQKFVPLLGGFGFTIGIISAMLLAQVFGLININPWKEFLYFWLGLLVIMTLGFLDDVRGVPSKVKFIGQGIAAVLLIAGGCKIQSFGGPIGDAFSLGIFSIPFTFLWIIFLINAINLLDGLDGLAGGVSLIITIGFIVISGHLGNQFLMILAIGLTAGILGFLRYNYHPAAIFMGDVGSLQLGYVLAFFSIEALKMSGSHQVYFLTSLIIFGVPLTDTLISFLRRLSQGKSPFYADLQHMHHRLMNLGLSHLQTVWVLYIFTVFFVLLGIFMVFFQGIVSLLLFLIGFMMAVYWIWRLGYVETRYSFQKLTYQIKQLDQIRHRAPIHIKRIWHRLLLFVSDIFTINGVLFIVYWIKFHSRIIEPVEYRSLADYFTTPAFLLFTLGWIFLFWINNLYQMDWDVSRLDKFWRVTKVSSFGILILGFITIDLSEIISESQILSLGIYWLFMITLVNFGRFIVIEIEKILKIFEYSPKKTLIIGCNEIGKKVLQDIRSNPHLIFDVVGFISKKIEGKDFYGVPVIGNYSKLPDLIHQNKIEEVIITLPDSATEDFIQILSVCEAQDVKIKVPPDIHDFYMGKQVGLVSHAYFRIFHENMVLWQWMIKRAGDILSSFCLLLLLSPFLLITAIYCWIRYRKSALINIPILGKHGIPFNMYVFRLTDIEYHFEKNPIYIGSKDEQTSLKGYAKFLYNSRFYKLPQILNVLLGDMSMVGPRPEPPEWYEIYGQTLRFSHRRITIRPGLTGLAQVKYRYELSQRILQERIKFDILYIENISLRLDFRILVNTILLIVKNSKKIIDSDSLREERNESKQI